MKLALVLLAACGGPEHFPDAQIDSTPDTWSFVPVSGTTCGDGSPAAIAINGSPSGSGDLFVYFEGGGACWDENTCFTIKSAVRIDTPYDLAAYQSELPTFSSSPLFARGTATNPFKDATYVYVPYCTGDLHAGLRVATYGTHTVHHTGFSNAATFVRALLPTLPHLSRIWVTGSSAGGYGATLDMSLFADAWPAAEVDVLQDSAPFVDVLAAYDTWRTAWALRFPDGCTACASSFPAVIDAVTTDHPQARIGLLTYREDATIKQFFGYTGSLAPAIDSLVGMHYAQATTHAFELDGSSHTMLGQYTTLASAGGVKLVDWIAQWATGDPAWATVTP